MTLAMFETDIDNERMKYLVLFVAAILFCLILGSTL